MGSGVAVAGRGGIGSCCGQFTCILSHLLEVPTSLSRLNYELASYLGVLNYNCVKYLKCHKANKVNIPLGSGSKKKKGNKHLKGEKEIGKIRNRRRYFECAQCSRSAVYTFEMTQGWF